MDLLEFTAAVIDAIAWPVTACIIVVLLRQHIAAALTSVRRIRHKDTEIDFEQGVKDAIVVAGKSTELPPADRQHDETGELVELSPRGAVLEAWLNVEKALLEFNGRNGIEPNTASERRGSRGILQILDYDILSTGTIELLHHLRQLRNKAVHLTDTDIDPGIASEYVAIAKRVIGAIANAEIKNN